MSSKIVGEPFQGKYGEKMDNIYGVKHALYEFPGKCLLPPVYCADAQNIRDFNVREDDTWVVSFPRTGSTWCQEMVWLLCNNLDFDSAQKIPQQYRCPLIEMDTVLFEYSDAIKKLLNTKSTVEFVDKMPSPRFIKSHLPIDLLPEQLNKVQPKIIYTIRNPKDMCVSYYHHLQMFHYMNESFEEFCDLLLNDALPMGSLWNHYLGFWAKRNEPNVLILKYENMSKDTKATIRQLAKFLEKDVSDRDVDAMSDYLSLNKMRNNKGCNLQDFIDMIKGDGYYEKSGEHFIRKGIIGDHKNYMSPELSARFDKWIEDNTKGTGLSFDM